jgi:CRP/FNR family cyclic AMP-dependent transcriptional regulator
MSNYLMHMMARVGMSEQLSRSMLQHAKLVSYEPEQMIWKKGDTLDYWQLVIEGLVVASAPKGDGERMPMFIYGNHTWFGEQSILNRRPTALDYHAASDVQAMRLPAALMVQALDREPMFLKRVASMVSWRAEMSADTLALMKFGSPAMRVVMGLGLFTEALASHSERPPTIGFDGGLEIPVTQAVLARLCGVSRTLFSEYLQQLAANSWVRIGYGKLEVQSIGTWQRFLRCLRRDSVSLGTATIEDLLTQLDVHAVV